MTKRRRTAPPALSTSTAIVLTRSAEEEAWHDLQITIRKRRQRIRKLQQEIRPLEEALARFERNFRIQLGGLQEELRRLRAEAHTLEHRTERIHARIAADPTDELGDLFTPEELEEIGKFFDFDIPDSWLERNAEGDADPGGEGFDDEHFDASGEGWHRIEEPETGRKGGGKFEELKALYRSLARRFHPDLRTDAEDTAYRHECMLRANHAWQLGDLDMLQELADETERLAPDWGAWTWLRRLQSARRENDRITRQISKLRRRLKELRTNETFPLWSSGGLGESLISARRKSLERDIAMAKNDLSSAQDGFRAAMEQWADQKATA
jgi:predicted  nucleic acid-binding Zn-ribbon protein